MVTSGREGDEMLGGTTEAAREGVLWRRGGRRRGVGGGGVGEGGGGYPCVSVREGAADVLGGGGGEIGVRSKELGACPGAVVRNGDWLGQSNHVSRVVSNWG